jgi:DNA polymerase V
MATMDAVNTRFGRGTVALAAGIKKPWATKFEQRSPCYTTQLDEAPCL